MITVPDHDWSRSSVGYYMLFSITPNVGTHAWTYSFTTIDGLLLLCFTLLISELEYALPAWDITTTNASKLECVKWKSAALSFSHPPPHIPYNYAVALELLQLHTLLQVTRRYFDTVFLIHVFPRPKFCPSTIDNSSLQVPSCNSRNFTHFSAGHNSFPSTRCCKFGMQRCRYKYTEYQIRSLTHSLQWQ